MNYEEIEAIRATLGLTIKSFARILGVSHTTYYSWSGRGKQVTGSTLILAKLLKADPMGMYQKIYSMLENT